MSKVPKLLLVLLPLAALLALGGALLMPGQPAQAAGRPMVGSAIGVAQVDGHDVIVHVTVAAPGAVSLADAADAALRGYGARPIGSSAYSLTGLRWSAYADADPSNDSPVTQQYNPNGAPLAGFDQTLQAIQGTWSAPSPFDFAYGGETVRCPSLVQECGAQDFDTFSDVGWLALSDRNVLGVTWYDPAFDEADIALNTQFDWTLTINDEGPAPGCHGPVIRCYVFDAHTVLLHEEGHAAGLGHSTVSGAVMEASYAGVRRSLQPDDIAGIQALYGGGGDPGDPGDPATTVAVTGLDEFFNGGGRNGDRDFYVAVTLGDDQGAAVAGASVSIRIESGGIAWVGTGPTDASGLVRFRVRNAPAGCFTSIVTDVTAAGLTWDSADPANQSDGTTCKGG